MGLLSLDKVLGPPGYGEHTASVLLPQIPEHCKGNTGLVELGLVGSILVS